MDRLSDHRFVANYFRLYLHAAAMNLLVRLRRFIAEPLPAPFQPVFLFVLQPALDQLVLAPPAIGERLPVGLEIVTLESSAANLFGEETIFDGMIYVLEEVAVDSRIDTSLRPAGIHQQDGDSLLFGGRSVGPVKERTHKD